MKDSVIEKGLNNLLINILNSQLFCSAYNNPQGYHDLKSGNTFSITETYTMHMKDNCNNMQLGKKFWICSDKFSRLNNICVL